MRLRRSTWVQGVVCAFVLVNGVIYQSYLSGYAQRKWLSVSDMNPYGGWHALNGMIADASYRYGGMTHAIALTIAITVCALLFGRVFCGWICPIGTLQDLSSYFGRVFGFPSIRLKALCGIPMEGFKYLVLIGALTVSVLGGGQILGGFSPWFAFLSVSGGQLALGSAALLVGVLLISSVIKRAFCRYLCPLGAYQALLSAVGLTRVKPGQSCEGCQKCLVQCPVDIQLDSSAEVSPECVLCMGCVEKDSGCQLGAYHLAWMGKRRSAQTFSWVAIVVFLALYGLLPLTPKTKGREAFGLEQVYQDGTYQGVASGYGGPLRVELVVENHKIAAITVINHAESPGYYQEVFKVVTKTVIESQSLDVDHISGATVTTRGFLSAIRVALQQSVNTEGVQTE